MRARRYAKSLRPSATFHCTRLGSTSRPLCATYLPAEELALVGCIDRHLYLYDCEHVDAQGEFTAQRVGHWQLPALSAHVVTSWVDQKGDGCLATGDKAGLVNVWDTAALVKGAKQCAIAERSTDLRRAVLAPCATSAARASRDLKRS